MSNLVITQGSWLACSHRVAPGNGVANNGLSSLLVVGGSPVLLVGDLIGGTISGCTQVVSSSTTPCTVVLARSAGAATKLTVGGLAVLTDATSGSTDGLPAPPPPGAGFSVTDAKQAKLRTV